MTTESYLVRRKQLTTYFDKTAVNAWKALTSDTPVNRIRQTVRAGRDAMRASILERLPQDLDGRRILDAGCGTGVLAVELAQRGASVIAVDVAENLVEAAQRRYDASATRGQIEFTVGDMCANRYGDFDHVVAMDSFIHYESEDAVAALAGICRSVRHSVLFTFAPRTALLAAMHRVGRLIPQASNRAPAIVPVEPASLQRMLDAALGEHGWSITWTERVKNGFYISQAMELTRSCGD